MNMDFVFEMQRPVKSCCVCTVQHTPRFEAFFQEVTIFRIESQPWFFVYSLVDHHFLHPIEIFDSQKQTIAHHSVQRQSKRLFPTKSQRNECVLCEGESIFQSNSWLSKWLSPKSMSCSSRRMSRVISSAFDQQWFMTNFVSDYHLVCAITQRNRDFLVCSFPCSWSERLKWAKSESNEQQLMYAIFDRYIFCLLFFVLLWFADLEFAFKSRFGNLRNFQ